jgi:hypothetical protein
LLGRVNTGRIAGANRRTDYRTRRERATNA